MRPDAPRTVEEAAERVALAVADLVALQLQAVLEATADTTPAPDRPGPFPQDDILWFDTSQAGDHAGRHPVTVRRALEAGELHGGQPKPGGRWRIHRDCLDAWVARTSCPHGIGGGC